MDRGQFIESPLGRRRVLPRLTPDQYAVGRINMPWGVKLACKANKSPGGFQAGDDFYLVLTGPYLEPQLVDRVVQIAREETRQYGGKDDLWNTGPFQIGDPHYDAFRFIHALEHRVTGDIFGRKVNLIPKITGRVWGGTTIYGFKPPFHQRNLWIGFHIDPRLATAQDVRTSVLNVLRG